MLRLDEFESAFRSADKDQFRLARPDVKRILVVSDLEGEEQARYLAAVQEFLGVLAPPEWLVLTGAEYTRVDELLEKEEAAAPDLIVAYRNLKSQAWRWPFSLGSFLNVLTQKAETPVLVVPNPHEFPDLAWKGSDTDSVMVVADHLTGDDTLVNWGVRLTRNSGTLYLTHIEDDQTFERYIRTIGKIPNLDTEVAREEILEQLLKEPLDFIDTCRKGIAEGDFGFQVESIVQTGHRVSDYQALTEKYEVDVLIFRSQDDDQVAMHGTAYPLAVELRNLPLLLI
ncbi:MAG: hypothetical protein DRJ42_16585 [Deltaproteobacteria bacterium]|nr:MAG: hypothetical protein DRJ42_16585 [Deltaproteobacteria bacterium]